MCEMYSSWGVSVNGNWCLCVKADVCIGYLINININIYNTVDTFEVPQFLSGPAVVNKEQPVICLCRKSSGVNQGP